MNTASPRLSMIQAKDAFENGNWHQARQAYLNVLSAEPNNAEAMLQLSYVESFLDDCREADAWARKTLATRSKDPRLLLDLIRRLRTFNRIQMLHELASRLLADKQTSSMVLVECARQLSNANEFGQALRCAEAAFAQAPKHPGIRLTYGQLLAHHGNTDEASRHFEQVLKHNPRIGIAWWMLSRLTRQTRLSNHVEAMKKIMATTNLDSQNTAAMARALHKELDDIGDHEQAWMALELMCRARRSTFDHDPNAATKLVDALTSTHTGSSQINHKLGKTPIFIVGMHRSGTTLLEQLLGTNASVNSLGELFDFPCALRYAANHYSKDAIDVLHVARLANMDMTEVGQRYMSDLAWRIDDKATHFTDKLPANFLNIGFIFNALPQARILHLVRDPIETCFSNLRELYSDINSWSYDQHELGNYFIQYRRLMAHWRARWPDWILDVSYAELTRNTEIVMRQVTDFCGLAYSPAMTDPRNSQRAVSTASSVQVREGVTQRETPKWLPYKNHLRPLIETLERGGVALPNMD